MKAVKLIDLVSKIFPDFTEEKKREAAKRITEYRGKLIRTRYRKELQSN